MPESWLPACATVRAATPGETMMNTSRNRKLTAFGRSQTIAMWARELKINYRTLKSRIRNGWTVERALSTRTDRRAKPTSTSSMTRTLMRGDAMRYIVLQSDVQERCRAARVCSVALLRCLKIQRVDRHQLDRGSLIKFRRQKDHSRNTTVRGKRQSVDQRLVRQDPVIARRQYAIDSFQGKWELELN